MYQINVTKNLIAASSTGLGTISSANAVTLNTSSLGTPRRITIWGASGSNGTYRLTGTNETGLPISETVVGSTVPAAVFNSVQDFLTLSSVSVSGTIASTTTYIGTNTQGGTPWKPVDAWRTPINLGFNVTPTTTGVIASFELSQDYPSYNPLTGLWDGQNPTTGPAASISTACSSVAAATNGSITAPIAAWRITLTSTSSGAGSVNASVTQAG